MASVSAKRRIRRERQEADVGFLSEAAERALGGEVPTKSLNRRSTHGVPSEQGVRLRTGGGQLAAACRGRPKWMVSDRGQGQRDVARVAGAESSQLRGHPGYARP